MHTDHVHVGEDAGLTAKQLTIIRDLHTPLPLPSSPEPLTAFQAAALRFADASTFSVNVPQSRIDDLKQYLKDEQQLLEATAVAATYNMVSRLLVTLDVGDMGNVSVPLPETKQEEHDIEVEAGVKLHVRVAKRDDNSPWLIFVNSLMTNQKMWDGVLPRLSKKYNLITYDQRGHGKVRRITKAVCAQNDSQTCSVHSPQHLHQRPRCPSSPKTSPPFCPNCQSLHRFMLWSASLRAEQPLSPLPTSTRISSAALSHVIRRRPLLRQTAKHGTNASLSLASRA